MAKGIQSSHGKLTHTHSFVYIHRLEIERSYTVPAQLLLISHEIQPQVQFSVFKRDAALEIISSSNTMKHTHGGKKTLQRCKKIPLLIHLDHQRALLFSLYNS